MSRMRTHQIVYGILFWFSAIGAESEGSDIEEINSDNKSGLDGAEETPEETEGNPYEGEVNGEEEELQQDKEGQHAEDTAEDSEVRRSLGAIA